MPKLLDSARAPILGSSDDDVNTENGTSLFLRAKLNSVIQNPP
jgi:hypothetical protein